jgi:uncharacterized protein (DUF362 family)
LVAVAIAHDPTSIEPAVERALGHLPLEALVRDRVVAVKPNETFATADDTSAVTQPDTLRAVLRVLSRFQPAQLIVSGGAGAAETEDVFRVAGLLDVIRQAGAELFDHNRPPFTPVELTYAPQRDVDGPQRQVMVNPRVLEYQTLVSLAQLKLHDTATVTLTLKNIAMSLPAADYYGHPRSQERHEHAFFDDMHSFIVAMARRFPIHIGIIAGHPAMIGTGPLGGHAVETGLVIASTDPVAADVVGARLLGFGPQAVRHLWEAQRIQLGETSTERMQFPELGVRQAIEIFSLAAYGKRLTFNQ